MEVRAKDIKGAIGAQHIRAFQSTEQTGTGAGQNIAHNLGQAPALVIVSITTGHDGAGGAGTQVPTITQGAHDATNVVVTCTAGAKYMVVAL